MLDQDRRLVCPSFPGEEDVAANFGSWIPTTGTAKVGTGNYMALASTHYRHGSAGSKVWKVACRTAAGSLAAAAAKHCASGGAYCGNGGLPFPGHVTGGSSAETRPGLQSLSDGTSKVALITESREESHHVLVQRLGVLRRRRLAGQRHSDRPGGMQPATGGPIYWNCGRQLRYRAQQGRHEGRQRRSIIRTTNPHESARTA